MTSRGGFILIPDHPFYDEEGEISPGMRLRTIRDTLDSVRAGGDIQPDILGTRLNLSHLGFDPEDYPFGQLNIMLHQCRRLAESLAQGLPGGLRCAHFEAEQGPFAVLVPSSEGVQIVTFEMPFGTTGQWPVEGVDGMPETDFYGMFMSKFNQREISELNTGHPQSNISGIRHAKLGVTVPEMVSLLNRDVSEGLTLLEYLELPTDLSWYWELWDERGW